MTEIADFAILYYFGLYIETHLGIQIDFESFGQWIADRNYQFLLCQRKKNKTQSEQSLHFKELYLEF